METRPLGSKVSRKYKHFLWLYDKLAELFPCISLPPLPVKQYSGKLVSMGLAIEGCGPQLLFLCQLCFACSCMTVCGVFLV